MSKETGEMYKSLKELIPDWVTSLKGMELKLPIPDLDFSPTSIDGDIYHSPKEILNKGEEELHRPDFSGMKCEVCGELVEKDFSWYYLKSKNVDESNVICSHECLKKFYESGDNNCFEIFEYSRCSAYYHCKEIGNLRNMCEHKKNKSYTKIISPTRRIHCEPAQAGLILSTHKMTNVLEEFSQESKSQYESNTKLITKSGKESRKQFRITTAMTILVIILTIVNLIPAFSGENSRMISILSNINTGTNELNELILQNNIKREEILTQANKIEELEETIMGIEKDLKKFINKYGEESKIINDIIDDIYKLSKSN